jgi:membrane-associated phospholipid phosphatase
MSRDAPIRLPPTRADLAASRAVARATGVRAERTLQVVTWLADEKVVLGAAALFWMHARLNMQDRRLAGEADRLLCGVAVAGVLPHVFKRLVRRRRPDRTVVHRRRRGIPHSGNAWDSFPSGHAVHLGVVAAALMRLAPRRYRPLVLPAVAALAATRIGLLAHYPSDVAAGLGLGVLLDTAVGGLSRVARALSRIPRRAP